MRSYRADLRGQGTWAQGCWQRQQVIVQTYERASTTCGAPCACPTFPLHTHHQVPVDCAQSMEFTSWCMRMT